MSAPDRPCIVNTEVLAKCPFCRLSIGFGLVPKPFAIHALPMCETFKRLDALEFIEVVNKKLDRENS